MSLENNTVFNIEWKVTPLKDKPKEHGWSDDGIVNNKVYFKMFYNNEDSKVYLYDLTEQQYYILPDGAKYSGYLIAFKLFKLNKNVISQPPTSDI